MTECSHVPVIFAVDERADLRHHAGTHVKIPLLPGIKQQKQH